MSGALVPVSKKRGAVRAVRTAQGSRRPLSYVEELDRKSKRRVRSGAKSPENQANADFQAERRRQLQRPAALRRMPVPPSRQRAQANAAAKERAFRESMGHPANAVQRGLRNVRMDPFPATLMATSAPVLYLGSRSRLEKRDGRNTDALQVAGAGLGGQAAFRAAGFSLKRSGNKARRSTPTGRPEGMSEARYKQIMQRHENQHGVHGYGQAGSQKHMDMIRQNPSYNREYPKQLLGSRQKRILGQMSGGRGRALEAASVALPAAVVYRQQRKKRGVAKADLYTRERNTSATRAATAAGGLGLIAYGGSRNEIFQRGITAAGSRERLKTVATFVEAGRKTTERATGAAARRIGNAPGIGRNLKKVPAGYRPAVAGLAGLAMFRGARPITRDEYKPYTVQGW